MVTNSEKSLPVEANKDSSSHFFAGIDKYHLIVFLCCWLGGIFDGMDSTLMSVVLPSAISELIASTDKLLVSQIGSYVSAIFLLGWTAGGVVFGYIGDKFGRVKSMVFSILLYAIFTGLSGLAHNWPELAVCRFLTGLGIGGELVSIATFLSEVWPERSRAVAVGALITSYQAGVFLSGSVNYVFSNWRHAFFVGALPALLVILLRMTLKESDKWIAQAHGHSEETKQTSGEFSKSLMKELFNPKNYKSLFIGGFSFGALLVGYWASLSWIPTWILSLLQNPSSSSERSLATMIQGAAAMIGCSSAGFLCEHFGRKKTLLVSFLGCFGASYLLFMTNNSFTNLIYWQVALLGYFIGLAQATLYIYLPELFNTKVRASGTGFCLNVGRLVTIISVLFVGTLVALFGGYSKAAFAFSFAYLFGSLVCLFASETKGKELPE